MRKPLFSVTKKDLIIQTFSAERHTTPLSTPCLLWEGSRDKNGYGKTTRNGKSIRAHRLAWIQARGPIEDGMWILHHCDNPTCINIDHLYLANHTDNMQDRKARGRTPDFMGEKHPRAKLTNEQVAEMRESYADGVSLDALAKSYDMSKSSICEIVNHKRYKSNQNKTQSGVRIIHPASGARGEGREFCSQKQNKEAAFIRLNESSVFKAWLKAETARRLMDQHEIHRRVNRQVDMWITPKNLKVEMLRDGKWIEQDVADE